MYMSARRFCAAAGLLAATAFGAGQAMAIPSVTTCDSAGIGSVTLTADGPPVTVTYQLTERGRDVTFEQVESEIAHGVGAT